MSDPEKDYKRRVTQALLFHGWLVQEHEDKFGNFIPDLSFSANRTGGWIEVKYCDPEPVCLDMIPHWTRGQEHWLYDHGRAGTGHCYLLVGTPDDNFLWRYSELRATRVQSFRGAWQSIFIKEPTIFDLAGEMNRRIGPPGLRGVASYGVGPG